MPPSTLTGHVRLQKTLVLRDALAAELGLNLSSGAMLSLREIEEDHGAASALHEGRYLSALDAYCQNDHRPRLAELDDAVRRACERVKLGPRYAQYLALLLFAAWIEARDEDADAFLERLNHQLAQRQPADRPEPFTENDLQMAAFWMATAAGKTHVLHACLALLEKRGDWNRIFLITPSEALTRQHADKLREAYPLNVFAYPNDGDAMQLGRQPNGTVIVLDINKLADAKKGEGLTVPTQAFQDGRNLVFVDEGHKGQKSEASAWKKLQQDLAGIGAADHKHRGLLIEFSATFGQVAEKEHAFHRYAKTIVFDYAYDRFHADRYGKDFWNVRLEGRGDASEAVRRQTLTAALVAFWHQVACFNHSATRAKAASEGLRVQAPLWVLLGLSVIGGGKNEDDKAQTSDVVEVLRYLAGILADAAPLAADLRNLRATQVSGPALLPAEAQTALDAHPDPEALARRILRDVFAWNPGDKPIFRLLKRASGELGLGLLHGDQSTYYGVVNVGDANGLKKAMEPAGLEVEDDALTDSLFAKLDRDNSGLNLLIGSRRFAEGWDNYRASSLTLLRLGQSEGALIVQMFGRVVRFAGKNGDGRRLDHPQDLKPLQTAYVYGLQSKYLEVFLDSLRKNGTGNFERTECPIEICPTLPSVLRAVAMSEPSRADFQVSATGSDWLGRIQNPITLAMGASVTVGTMRHGTLSTETGHAGQDVTGDFKRWLHLVDRDALYRELVDYRRQKRWWNLTFDRPAIDAALDSDRYRIDGLPALFEQIATDSDWARLNRTAARLVRQLFERAYLRQENAHCPPCLVEIPHSGIPKSYHKTQYTVEPHG